MSEFKGKGSNPRPTKITAREKDLRWELAFGKDEEKKAKAKADLDKLLAEQKDD